MDRLFVIYKNRKRCTKPLLGVIVSSDQNNSLNKKITEIELVSGRKVCASIDDFRVCYNQREIMLEMFDYIQQNLNRSYRGY